MYGTANPRAVTAKAHSFERVGPDGSSLYALSKAGVRALRRVGIAARSGGDKLRHFGLAYFCHRCIANEIAISGIVWGFRVATERELARGHWVGGMAGIAGKKPDVLIRVRNRIWWVEVKKSRKNSKKYDRLVRWLGIVLFDAARVDGTQLLGNRLQWGKVIFVCGEHFEHRLLRDLANEGHAPERLRMLISFWRLLYTIEDIEFS